MNPPLTLPRRGTDSTRTNVCSPPGRGRGWVGSWKGETAVRPPPSVAYPQDSPVRERQRKTFPTRLTCDSAAAQLGIVVTKTVYVSARCHPDRLPSSPRPGPREPGARG